MRQLNKRCQQNQGRDVHERRRFPLQRLATSLCGLAAFLEIVPESRRGRRGLGHKRKVILGPGATTWEPGRPSGIREQVASKQQRGLQATGYNGCYLPGSARLLEIATGRSTSFYYGKGGDGWQYDRPQPAAAKWPAWSIQRTTEAGWMGWRAVRTLEPAHEWREGVYQRNTVRPRVDTAFTQVAERSQGRTVIPSTLPDRQPASNLPPSSPPVSIHLRLVHSTSTRRPSPGGDEGVAMDDEEARPSGRPDRQSSLRLSTILPIDHESSIDNPGVSDGFNYTPGVAQDPFSSHDARSPGARMSQVSNPFASPIEDPNNVEPRDQKDPAGPHCPPPPVTTSTHPTNLKSHAFSAPNPPSTPPAQNRASSIASSYAFPRVQSPYQGATGPSHPYAMYPQGITRTASIATASTDRPRERDSTVPHAPAHPYMMYPQNTVPESESGSPTISPAPIPVGFPGLSQNYQRRLGPEGEEAQDIVGPDGHTEQLPPYTRYPDGVEPKPAAVVTTDIETGAATEVNANQTQASSLASPQSRESTRSAASESSRAELNVAEAPPTAPAAGIPFSEKFVQKTKLRVCKGKVPMWLVLVLIVGLCIIAGVLGGVITRVLDKKHHHPPPPSNSSTSAQEAASNTSDSPTTVTVTTTFDASPIATPTASLPPLALGTYSLPLQDSSESSNQCLSDPGTMSAWSCDIYNPQLLIEVSQPSNSPSASVQLSTAQQTSQPKYYGTQPPVFSGNRALGTVMDLSDTQLGPAYFFWTPYTKVVIVPQANFSVGNPNGKRDLDRFFEEDSTDAEWLLPRDSSNGPVVQPGDKPWYCFWNNTILEGFIYVTQNCSNSVSSVSSGTATASATGSAPSSSTSSIAYPKYIKIEERRAPGIEYISEPYCVQAQMLDDNQPGFLLNTKVQLNESEPTSQNQYAGSKRRRAWWDDLLGSRALMKRSSGECECAWLVT